MERSVHLTEPGAARVGRNLQLQEREQTERGDVSVNFRLKPPPKNLEEENFTIAILTCILFFFFFFFFFSVYDKDKEIAYDFTCNDVEQTATVTRPEEGILTRYLTPFGEPYLTVSPEHIFMKPFLVSNPRPKARRGMSTMLGTISCWSLPIARVLLIGFLLLFPLKARSAMNLWSHHCFLYKHPSSIVSLSLNRVNDPL
ncbi:hypothetical protein NE237_018307 [Protea cynaroides]|uniref:Uncharacterized protein n=1 Tax=Protea cynaroides TaxID=273540 RepID=A0A9Q0K9L3_9MAGN|nr:hypothetical protein NE237_018307 [Protea cynaroides]